MFAQVAWNGVSCWNSANRLNENNIAMIDRDDVKMIYPVDLNVSALQISLPFFAERPYCYFRLIEMGSCGWLQIQCKDLFMENLILTHIILEFGRQM